MIRVVTVDVDEVSGTEAVAVPDLDACGSCIPECVLDARSRPTSAITAKSFATSSSYDHIAGESSDLAPEDFLSTEYSVISFHQGQFRKEKNEFI